MISLTALGALSLVSAPIVQKIAKINENKRTVVLSQHYMMEGKQAFDGVLVMGPTNTGKTQSVFIPSLEALTKKENVLFVTDPKGEIYNAYTKMDSSVTRGRKLYRFVLDQHNSAQYNPLSFCSTKEEVLLLGEAILGENDTSLAASLLNAVLLLLWSGKWKSPAPQSIPEALEFLLTKTHEVEKAVGAYPPAKLQYELYHNTVQHPETHAEVFSVLVKRVKLFVADSKMNRILKGNDMPSNFRKEKSIVFLQYPEQSNYYGAFAGMFLYQMINYSMNQNQKNSLPVYFLLDELGNIGKIPHLEELSSECRYREISLVVGIQVYEQLEKIYGEKEAAIIYQNLKNKVIFPGISGKIAAEISDSFGEKYIPNEHGGYYRKRISASDITHLRYGKVLILAANRKRPVIAKRTRIKECAL